MIQTIVLLTGLACIFFQSKEMRGQYAAQSGRYRSVRGEVAFFAPSYIEDISANSQNVDASLNTQSGACEVIIPVNSFRFKKALMQKHFNERYMESAEFPEAKFKGKIVKGLPDILRAGQQIDVQGELTIHGISRPRIIHLAIGPESDGNILMAGKFDVVLEHHAVEPPVVLFRKVAESVTVSIELHLTPAK
jgi:polyisoprenoid-binding protein YceI